MTPPGPIALRAVAIAEEEARRGVREIGGNNCGPEVEAYLEAVGLPEGNAWCCAFVRYCLEAAAEDVDMPDGYPDSGWCPSVEAWARKRNLWIPMAVRFRPMRGDLALFWFEVKGRVAHIGFVADVLADGSIRTVEGNTSGDTAMSRDGDGVYIKHRPVAALGSRGGYVRLSW